jgi:hypothetical protein
MFFHIMVKHNPRKKKKKKKSFSLYIMVAWSIFVSTILHVACKLIPRHCRKFCSLVLSKLHLSPKRPYKKTIMHHKSGIGSTISQEASPREGLLIFQEPSPQKLHRSNRNMDFSTNSCFDNLSDVFDDGHFKKIVTRKLLKFNSNMHSS